MDELKYNLVTPDGEFYFSRKQLKQFPMLEKKMPHTLELEVSCSGECIQKFQELVAYMESRDNNQRFDSINTILRLTKNGALDYDWALGWITDDNILREMTSFAEQYNLSHVNHVLGIIYAAIFKNNSPEEIRERFMQQEDHESDSDEVDWSEFM